MSFITWREYSKGKIDMLTLIWNPTKDSTLFKILRFLLKGEKYKHKVLSWVQRRQYWIRIYMKNAIENEKKNFFSISAYSIVFLIIQTKFCIVALKSHGLRVMVSISSISKCILLINRYRRKRPKVDASIFDSAQSHTRRSEASEKRRK